MRHHGFPVRAAGLAAGAALLGSIVGASAQMPWDPPKDPNRVQANLVRQDGSDCQNSNVPSGGSPSDSGVVVVTRKPNGTTDVTVGLTAKPNTNYEFNLKCVRTLGRLRTDDEGAATATFSFPTNSVGNVYAFDMNPDGPRPGNTFQSAQVVFK